MGVLTQGVIGRLKPIVDSIDGMLARTQDERGTLLIRPYEGLSVGTLKKYIENYKYSIKRDEWKGRFRMTKKKDDKGDYIEIDFSPGVLKVNFEMEEILPPHMQVEDSNMKTIVPEIEVSRVLPSFFQGNGALEMSDNVAVAHLIMEDPTHAVFERAYLSEETWLAAEGKGPPTAFTMAAQKKGYVVETFKDRYVSVSRDSRSF